MKEPKSAFIKNPEPIIPGNGLKRTFAAESREIYTQNSGSLITFQPAFYCRGMPTTLFNPNPYFVMIGGNFRG